MPTKLFIITGANKGLGQAFVKNLLGMVDTTLVSLSRHISPEQMGYPAEKFRHIFCDLSKEIDTATLAPLKENILPGTKIYFINNAATIEPLGEFSLADYAAIADAVQTNITGPLFIVRYLLSAFAGYEMKLINISSGAANRSISHWAMYGASKAFMNRFFETVQEEDKEHGNISCISIDPGMIDTAMQEKIRSVDFPLHTVFQEAKESGRLNSADAVAARIIGELQPL